MSTNDNLLPMDTNRLLEEARGLARNENYHGAQGILEMLLEQHSNDSRINAVLAYVHARQGDMDSAVKDMSAAISICPEEPAYFFKRGTYYLDAGELRRAIEDFSSVIELCNRHNDKYYEETAHFYRAEAFLRAGNLESAKADCNHARDGFRVWIDHLRTKEDIIAECAR